MRFNFHTRGGLNYSLNVKVLWLRSRLRKSIDTVIIGVNGRNYAAINRAAASPRWQVCAKILLFLCVFILVG